jgi:L-fuculose-phosphate aldolase
MNETALRDQLIATAIAMNRRGLNQGTAGNVSARVPEGFVLTPSGMPYDTMRSDDLVMLSPDGTLLAGHRKPSTEWPMHAAILRARPEVNAIIHAHALYCTVLACYRRPIPAFHYMVAIAGGDSIRCAPYATFGSVELSEHALTALSDRKACLLANHGMIALGTNLEDALRIALEVETLAAQYVLCLQMGEPTQIDAAEMSRVLEKFRDYGR